ncbi:14946_t:CDS:2 [Gigaspora rosea]|nr:14946_t:CDS:2 [Gigaspora rosea]
MPWDSYFDETPPDKYRYLGYYKHRKNQPDFTYILWKSLVLLSKNGPSEDAKKDHGRTSANTGKRKSMENSENKISENAKRNKSGNQGVDVGQSTSDELENTNEPTENFVNIEKLHYVNVIDMIRPSLIRMLHIYIFQENQDMESDDDMELTNLSPSNDFEKWFVGKHNISEDFHESKDKQQNS